MERTNIDPDDLQRPDWNSLKQNYSKHDVGEAYFVGRADQLGLQVEHWGIDMRHDDGKAIKDNKMDLRLWEPVDGQDAPATWPSDVPEALRPDTISTWHRREQQNGELHGADMDESDLDNCDQTWKLAGVVDVKTKANEDWLGAFNVRHYAHYAEWADTYDVPVFIYFTMVDMDAERVGDQNIVVPVSTDWDYHLVMDHFDSSESMSLDWTALKDEVAGSTIADRVSRAPDGNPVVWTKESEWRNFDYILDNVIRNE